MHSAGSLNIRLGELCRTAPDSTGNETALNSVVSIALVGRPLQIIRAIVCLYAVFMIYLRQPKRVRNPRQGH